jgi:hypothetical protein
VAMSNPVYVEAAGAEKRTPSLRADS